MPQKTYSEREVDAIARVAYATGARDVLIAAQDGRKPTEAQIATLTPFVLDDRILAKTVAEIISVASRLTWRRFASRLIAGMDKPDGE